MRVQPRPSALPSLLDAHVRSKGIVMDPVQQLGRHVDDGAARAAVVARLVDAATRDAADAKVSQHELAGGFPQLGVLGLEVRVDDVRCCECCKAGRDLGRRASDDVGEARRRREAPARQQHRDDEVRRAGLEAGCECGEARNRYDTGDVYEMAPAAQVVRPASHIAQGPEKSASRRTGTRWIIPRTASRFSASAMTTSCASSAGKPALLGEP